MSEKPLAAVEVGDGLVLLIHLDHANRYRGVTGLDEGLRQILRIE